MKKMWICAVLACVIASVGYAQPYKNLKPILSSAVKKAPASRSAGLNLGNKHIKLPPSVQRVHEFDVNVAYMDMQLNPSIFLPAVSARNNARIFKSLRKFLNDYAQFHENASKIADQLQARVTKGKIPYAAYLPKDLQMLYLGEVHDIPGVAEEVASLLSQLPKLYPNRRIYLATEFLPAYENRPFSLKNAITDPKEIAYLLDGTSRRTSRVLYAAAKHGIPVVGLEEEMGIINEIIRLSNRYPTEEMFEDFVVSFEGIRFRNRAWAKTLRALRAADPEALIVVYAGYGHLGYHRDSNLPALLGGKSFLALFTSTEFLPLNNPLFRYMNESEEILKAFNASPKAKLIESWKKPTRYKKIIGTDMAVILHPQN